MQYGKPTGSMEDILTAVVTAIKDGRQLPYQGVWIQELGQQVILDLFLYERPVFMRICNRLNLTWHEFSDAVAKALKEKDNEEKNGDSQGISKKE